MGASSGECLGPRVNASKPKISPESRCTMGWKTGVKPSPRMISCRRSLSFCACRRRMSAADSLASSMSFETEVCTSLGEAPG